MNGFNIMSKTEQEIITKMYELTEDVNPVEIADHIKYATLSDWCNAWRIEMKKCIRELMKGGETE